MSEYKRTFGWYVAKESTFTVEVKAWERIGVDGDSEWGWNVYAYVFEDHPLFDNDDSLKNLPFNCGCTFDQLSINQPLKLEYDFQKVTRTKKVGSDYMHLYDEGMERNSPENGIPSNVLFDAKELVSALTTEKENKNPTQN